MQVEVYRDPQRRSNYEEKLLIEIGVSSKWELRLQHKSINVLPWGCHVAACFGLLSHGDRKQAVVEGSADICPPLKLVWTPLYFS